MTGKKKKALCALATLVFLGSSLMVFIFAAEEQSVISGGLPTADKISLQKLIAKGTSNNKHIELADFYFGKNSIYTTQLTQFNKVYLPMFPRGQPENASHLRLLLLIRNDRYSNLPLIQTREEVDRFVADLNRAPRSLTGVLRTPLVRVRSLTLEAYPGTDRQSLEVLWARDFPTPGSVNLLWSVCGLFLAGTIVCFVAYRRLGRRSEDTQSRSSGVTQTLSSGDIQISLVVTASEAAAGKQVSVTIPESNESIRLKIPPGTRDGTRLRIRGKGRQVNSVGPSGDLYILLRVK